VTIAVRWIECAEPVVSTYAVAGNTATEIALVVGDAMVTLALTDLVVSVSEVAVIVTVFPAGTAEGAV